MGTFEIIVFSCLHIFPHGTENPEKYYTRAFREEFFGTFCRTSGYAAAVLWLYLFYREKCSVGGYWDFLYLRADYLLTALSMAQAEAQSFLGKDVGEAGVAACGGVCCGVAFGAEIVKSRLNKGIIMV